MTNDKIINFKQEQDVIGLEFQRAWTTVWKGKHGAVGSTSVLNTSPLISLPTQMILPIP